MKIRALLFAVICLAAFPATSRAQERGQVGITMGYPTAAGLIWHATDRIAVRPEITFSQATTKAELSLPNQSSEETSRTLGIGGSLLWYFGSSEGNVRPYISPRFTYNRAWTDDEGDEPQSSTTMGASFGVQYTPTRRIGFFGEIGAIRTHTEREFAGGGISVETSATTFSTRSAVGVIFYFGG